MSCEQELYGRLRQLGFRVTPQREMILSVLHDLEGHEPAEAIYNRVQVRSSAVDISTVYRTLGLLASMRVLVVTETADGQRRYALAHQHPAHVHALCARCGRQVEVDVQLFADVAEALRRSTGFELDLDLLRITGRCCECSFDSHPPSGA